MNRPMMHLVDPQTGESRPEDIRRVFASQEATAIAWRESTIAERISLIVSGLVALRKNMAAALPGRNDF